MKISFVTASGPAIAPFWNAGVAMMRLNAPGLQTIDCAVLVLMSVDPVMCPFVVVVSVASVIGAPPFMFSTSELN